MTRKWLLAIAAAPLMAAAARGQAPEASPRPAPVPQTSVPSAPAPSAATTPAKLDAERLAIWNSPDMLEARAWVVDYGQRSRRYGPQNAERFLTQLSQKSPAEMQAWLNKYLARRASLARAAEIDQQVREIKVLQALERQQAALQSYDQFNQGQTQGAALANERLRVRQQWGEAMASQRRADRDVILDQSYRPEYTWFYDPPLWIRQRYAAAALPGDLPRGDPRNFIRGDVPGPVEVRGPNAGPNGEGNGPNAGPVTNGFGGGPNAGPGGAGVSAGPNGGPGAGGAP